MPRDVGSHRGTSRVAAATSVCRIRRTRQAVLRELDLAVAALTDVRSGSVDSAPGAPEGSGRRSRPPTPASRQAEPPELWEQLDTIEQLVVELESATAVTECGELDPVLLASRLRAASAALERAGRALSRCRRQHEDSARPGEDPR